jgi:hypothetical protein
MSIYTDKPMVEKRFYRVIEQPDKIVILPHTLSSFLDVQAALEHACRHFFEEYATLPDLIVMNALDRIQLPSSEWEVFQHISLSGTDDLVVRYYYCIQIIRAREVICIGRETPTITHVYVLLEDAPLTPLEHIYDTSQHHLETFIALFLSS